MTRILLVFIGVVCLSAKAQVTKEIFESFKLQERRDVSYYYPEDYTEDKKYPLIIVLDADYLFDIVVANTKFYSSQGRMPQAIVAGIHQSKEELRWYDCAFDEESGLPDEKAKLFYEFIGTELIPYLDLNYSTAPFKMIVGYDITANFSNYFLFKERSLFNAYLTISPLLAPEMENRVPSRLLDHEKEIFYNLVLEKETTDHRQRLLQMNNAIASIQKENIHYFFDQYEEPDHVAIAAYGISKAFDNIFKSFRPISKTEYKKELLLSQEPAIDYLTNKYDMIKKLFGFEKEVLLNDIMAIYAASLKKEDYESMKPLSEICKAQFPETMLGFYFEGEYLELIGEPKKAFKAFEKAFQMNEIDFLTKDMALNKIDALKADFGY
ncbi:Putative hydrolase [Croceitalea dokdonensis DOKDO 023]|uniref:Putative hydrolase n=1 Tax=Croceitalea dokdonensis DOKDO 023 TaxID=1300341 RepID=A0A0P7AXK6_9FLAO|nr:alpha/beta hydrolase-fold protein [Croceitalea dokdonensis]KPM32915.1 Putative hydrolase [Croceitalea dokdonensis DOKDO 023]